MAYIYLYTKEIHLIDLFYNTRCISTRLLSRNRLLRIPISRALRRRILNLYQIPSPLLQQNLNPRSRRHNRRVAKRQFGLGVRKLEIVFGEEVHEELLHDGRGVPAPGTIPKDTHN